MTADRGAIDRKIIPRWRSWRIASRTGELRPLSAPKEPIQGSDDKARALSRLLEDFEESEGWPFASDLVGAALVLDYVPAFALDIALKLRADPDASAASRRLADRLLASADDAGSAAADSDAAQTVSDSQYRERIRLLKPILAREPRNAVRWMDLAWVYTAIGVHEKAARAVSVANHLGLGSRFLIRSAARFQVHRNDVDQAVHLLNSPASQLNDPWILAAEIATASLAGRTSKHIRAARRILDSSGLHPWHLSELASAVATVELAAGRHRQARQLMRTALASPTENSLAQAEWSVGAGALADLEEQLLGAPWGFEVRARHAGRVGDWESALSNGRLWLSDQPFALDAAMHLSHVASTGAEDYASAIAACRIGLHANPGEAGLVNNLAFALAQAGQLDEAELALAEAPLHLVTDRRRRGVLLATHGLLAFKRGRHDDGRILYANSVSILSREFPVLAALARIYWSREESKVDPLAAEYLYNAAMATGVKSDDGIVALLLGRLRTALAAKARGI